MTNGMARSGGEPTIAELLSDPIAQTLMRADGITVADVLAWIGRQRRSLERRHPQPPGPPRGPLGRADGCISGTAVNLGSTAAN